MLTNFFALEDNCFFFYNDTIYRKEGDFAVDENGIRCEFTGDTLIDPISFEDLEGLEFDELG